MAVSWSELITTPNRCISFYGARTSPFGVLHTIPTDRDTRLMRKDEVIYYLNVNHTNLNGLEDNRFVKHELLTNP